MTDLIQKIKEERHDEAEIRELAAKITEQHKQHMAKQQQVQQQQVQQRQFNLQHSSTNSNGQSNILSYLTRSQPSKNASQCTSNNSLGSDHETNKETENKNEADEESAKGHFGWVTFENGKVYIPYIFRQQEKYCSVRMVEMKLLNKYLNYLHQVIKRFF